MIASLSPVPWADPWVFVSVNGIALLVGAGLGHGIKYLHAYYCAAPRVWLANRVDELELEGLALETKNALLRSQLGKARWDDERREYESSLRMFWNCFKLPYTEFSSTKDEHDLGVVVERERWPDRRGSQVLKEFAHYMYPRDPASPRARDSADGFRKSVVHQLRQWSGRLNSVVDDDGGFGDYLNSLVAPTNMDTLKLLAYLEVAVAAGIGSGTRPADLGFLYKLRDDWEARSAPTPSIPDTEARPSPTPEGEHP